MRIEYDLAKLAEKAFFCDMITYISEYIQKTELSEDKSYIYIYCEDQYVDKVQQGISQLEEMMNKKLLGNEDGIDIQTIKDYSDRSTLCKEDIFQQMINSGMVYSLAEGSYAYSGTFLKVFKYFERKVEEYGLSCFEERGIEEQYVPALFSVDGYDEGGYFETFPHHIMFESVMKSDINVLSEFSETGWNNGSVFKNIKNPDCVLRTATCAPVYKHLKNTVIGENSVKTYLVSGKCFRNEGANVKNLSRLKEFYMTEYVFIGNAKHISECMLKAKEIWEYWMEVFNLNCKVETATDSFFANNYKKLKMFQLLGQSKQEFKLYIPGENQYISCGSANYHRTHFTKRYHICEGDENKLANSACFGLGIDRLAYALLSQKGLDITKWDEKTIREVSKYVNLKG